MAKLTIVSVAAEVAPYSKTGGLADVARSLPKSLKRLGHRVIIITPLYKKIIDAAGLHLKEIFTDVTVTLPRETNRTVSFLQGELMPGLPIYFVSCDKYFGRKQTLYGSGDENKRFYLFNEAALKLIELLKLTPDIIHCHDWHAGLIPELIKKHFKGVTAFDKAATVFTIHNLSFQLGHNWWEIPGKKRDNGTATLPDFEDQRHLERVNFAKRAIINADVINAVSETYAGELLKPKFGEHLHRILQNRKHKLFGIVNGIDYYEFAPATDPHLKRNFDYKTILRKNVNKHFLQKQYKLQTDEKIFIAAMASRIAEQKGFDIVLPIIPQLMKLPLQLIFMGDGDREYLKGINKLVRKYAGRIAVTPFTPNQNNETMLYAGADASLYPSRFEPCGTGQLKCMRYGCVPIAHAIGGLSDTVEDVDVKEDSGNGFVFRDYDAQSLLVAVTRAVSHYEHRREWRSLVVRCMKQSNSWEIPAKKYIELYFKAIKSKNGNE